MKPAFSTVALPDWTLPRIAKRAEAWGYQGVEFRTFGTGSTRLACDPALTDPAKVRAMFARAGVSLLSLATSCRFDEPVTPPVLGHLLDTERQVREARSAIDLAVSLECPFVRVFAFEAAGDERRSRAVARIAQRLEKVVDHCRNSGVRVLLENGGSFPRASDLAEFIDAVGSPLLAASYNLPVARAAGENPADGLNVLGDRTVICKVTDIRDGKACALGRGDLHAAADLAAIRGAGFGGWVVFEHDRLWLPGEGDADGVLTESAKAMYGVVREPAASR
jgi:sugar phosphate isomerase/epimerase